MAVTGEARTAFPAQDYPDLLYLPDHLVFAGETHLRDYLAQAGISAVSTAAFRVDTAAQFGKNLIKAALGRRIKLTLPYRSPSGASCCARESPKHRCGARPDTRCMASMPTNAGAPAARGALQSRSRA
jgi:hypothetical protein